MTYRSVKSFGKSLDLPNSINRILLKNGRYGKFGTSYAPNMFTDQLSAMFQKILDFYEVKIPIAN